MTRYFKMLVALVVALIAMVGGSQDARAESPSPAVCYVHTQGDLPRYAIVKAYSEIYYIGLATMQLKDRLKQYLDSMGVDYEDEMFPFNQTCVTLDGFDSGSVVERQRVLTETYNQLMSEFGAGGYHVIHY